MSPNPSRLLSAGFSQHIVSVRPIVFILIITLELVTTACDQALRDFAPQVSPQAQSSPQPQSLDVRIKSTPRHRVHLDIMPANAKVGPAQKIQFTATVTNTSKPAVTWTASAGSISSSGLFTAPMASTTQTVVITARSMARIGVWASVPVTVTGSASVLSNALHITTGALPAGTSNSVYTASIVAVGGQSPYDWSIASGSLPQGLRLDPATGTISGMTAQIGNFSFTVRVTSAGAQTAQQSFTLQLSPTNDGCGPPTYNCSRTDLNTIQVPNPLPNVGNLTGANTIVIDPDFKNPIVRITDAQTNPTKPNVTFSAGTGGSGDENVFNMDSTLILIGDTGGRHYPMSFNPATMQVVRMYVSSFPATNGMTLEAGGSWSNVDSQVLYVLTRGSVIQKYDFTNRTTPPRFQTLFDFKAGGNCLAANYSATWSVDGGHSKDDLTFAAGFSNSGPQGTGVDVVVWRVGSGCIHLNTQTGQVTGDFGETGTINLADRFTIHNLKLSRDGNSLTIGNTTCLTTCGNGQSPYIWHIGTTTLEYLAPTGQKGGGHATEGYTHWVNNGNSPILSEAIRAFSSPSSWTYVPTTPISGATFPIDQHQGWANVDPGDTLPFLLTTSSATTPFPACCYNEVEAISPISGTRWRFAHTYSSARSQRFETRNAIGGVSQDGNFYLFSSDWMGTLGSESGSDGCAVATNCRGDVFVVKLE
jgi:hypothetical protein